VKEKKSRKAYRSKDGLGRSGAALAAVLLMSLILIGFVAAVGLLSRRDIALVNIRQWEKQAKYAAHAGLMRALGELQPPNTSWEAGFDKVPMPDDPQLSYSVEVFNNYDGSKGLPGAWAPDGTTFVPRGAVWLRSVGIVGDRHTEGVAGLVGLAGNFRPTFDHALFGDSRVEVNAGSQISAFNSETGAPIAAPDGASIMSNASGTPAIRVTGAGTVVQGNAISGVSSDPLDPSVIEVSGGATVNQKLAADETTKILPFELARPAGIFLGNNLTLDGVTYQLPGHDPADPASPAGNYDMISLSNGATLELAAGTYFVSEIQVSGGSKIVLQSNVDEQHPVVIYVDRAVTILGNSEIGRSSPPLASEFLEAPRRLQVYFRDDPVTPAANHLLAMSGQCKAFMVCAGPRLQATISDQSELYGALMAGSATLAQASKVVYDARLEGVLMDGQGKLTILSTEDVSKEVAALVAQEEPVPPGSAVGAMPAGPGPGALASNIAPAPVVVVGPDGGIAGGAPAGPPAATADAALDAAANSLYAAGADYAALIAAFQADYQAAMLDMISSPEYVIGTTQLAALGTSTMYNTALNQFSTDINALVAAQGPDLAAAAAAYQAAADAYVAAGGTTTDVAAVGGFEAGL
jgi:hypothetical protein